MIHIHSLGRAARYFPERTALASAGTRSTFKELRARVARIAGALTRHGFKSGDRLVIQSDSIPDPIYDPDAILALIYTSGTTGRPKGVEIRHANILENVYHTNFWFPLEEGEVHLHAAPIFHIADFPFMFAAPAFSTCQVTIPKFSPESFCEIVQRERVTHTVLVPTMINMLTQFPDL